MEKRYLTEAPRRSARAARYRVDGSLLAATLTAGSVVFIWDDAEPDSDGELFVYVDGGRRGPMSYVDAEILSETPPVTTPAPRVEIVEETVVTTTKTVVLRLTEEEAALLADVVGSTTEGRHPGSGKLYRLLRPVA